MFPLFAALNVMNRVAHRGLPIALTFFAVTIAARAQFKELPPAPYSPAVAHQKIRTLLQNVEPGNRQQTTDALSGLAVWYRDILDDELIAAWKGDQRANLPALIAPLADAHVASAIVEFSWHQGRAAAFNLAYAPMLGDLMSRYPQSAEPFLNDLLGPAATGGQMPDLTQPEADAVCRILLDMPDTGNWKKAALQILPYYRLSAQNLLIQDLHGNNQEKSYQARLWIGELRLNVPELASNQQTSRSGLIPRQSQPAARAPVPGQTPSYAMSQRPHIVDQSSAAPYSTDAGNAPAGQFSAPPFLMPYSGPRSGTLKCTGSPVPPNAEYVFSGMPPGNIRLEVDAKIWDARLVPGEGQTQNLILTNKGANPQKKCSVHWSILP